MYQYKAYTLDRQIIEGTIDAATEDIAELRLHEAGYNHILTLKKTASPFSIEGVFPTLFSIKKTDIIDFFSQLATLMDARVPFVQALWILSEQTKRVAFKAVITKLGQQVAGGVPFSQALAQYPKLVSSQYCQVISVSEKSGDLPRGLRLVVSYLEKETGVSANIKKMLAYPVFLMALSIFVVLMVALMAVPALLKLFNSMNVALPLSTRILVGVADFLINYKFHLIAGVIVVVFSVLWLWKTPPVKRIVDQLLIKIPVFGSVIAMRNICRFCRTSSMLVEAGLTLPQSLNAVIGIIDNCVIKEALTDIRLDIIKGKPLSRQMANVKLFPRLLVDVISIGEKTGTMQSSFTTMADYYEKRLDKRMHKLMALIEPASILIVGLVISFIGISIIQPMYSIYQNLGQG